MFVEKVWVKRIWLGSVSYFSNLVYVQIYVYSPSWSRISTYDWVGTSIRWTFGTLMTCLFILPIILSVLLWMILTTNNLSLTVRKWGIDVDIYDRLYMSLAASTSQSLTMAIPKISFTKSHAEGMDEYNLIAALLATWYSWKWQIPNVWNQKCPKLRVKRSLTELQSNNIEQN